MALTRATARLHSAIDVAGGLSPSFLDLGGVPLVHVDRDDRARPIGEEGLDLVEQEVGPCREVSEEILVRPGRSVRLVPPASDTCDPRVHVSRRRIGRGEPVHRVQFLAAGFRATSRPRPTCPAADAFRHNVIPRSTSSYISWP